MLFRSELKKEFPGKTESWYKGKMRDIRKQRTMDYFNLNFDLSLDDNDCGDATGIAFYAYKNLTERND